MEFSVTLNSYMISFLNESEASFMLIFICCFGIPLFSVMVALLIKPLQRFNKLCTIITLPLWLTWGLSTAATLILYELDIEAIKIITVIGMLYVLMLTYCILNISLITKYFNSFAKTPS